ncbi:ribosomal RNA small methyltransferase [Salix suchowensis]|nr:ribosomal RNA small methyltransferase [Salix suchowensis]
MATKGSSLKSTSINGVKRYMVSSQQRNTVSWVGPQKHRPSRKDKSTEHANFLRRNNKNPADYRPDIIYQALLSILDSPLNKGWVFASSICENK